MKIKIILFIFALTIGVLAGFLYRGLAEKLAEEEKLSLQEEIASCIQQGSGIVRSFLVIHEKELSEGKVITSPASDKKWVIISQDRLAQILQEAESTKP